MVEEKEVLSAEEVASYLGFSKNWVYRKAEAGEIPGIKLGNRWRFKKSIIDRWLEETIGERFKGREARASLEAGELQEKILRIIQESPEGISLPEIGEKLGMNWRLLTSLTSELLREGKIKKEGKQYFPT